MGSTAANPQQRGGGSAAGQQAIKRVMTREQELREALGKHPSVLDSSLRPIRAAMREECAALLFADYKLAKAKDVEGLLWRTVFYKPIEEFRRRIKKAQDSGPPAAELLKKATKAMQDFLQDATVFYKRLIMRLQAVYGDLGIIFSLPPGAELAPPEKPAGDDCSAVDAAPSVARCLVFLGDLTRYAILYSSGLTQKMNACDWGPCAQYYTKAARVHPEGGQPHNQLAVLATYAEDELGAVYHYTRALSTASPFLTARENLVMLFDKSRQRAALLEAGASPQEPQRGRGGRGRGGRAGRGRKGPEFADGPTPGSVVSRYIRLAGILFTKTSLETLPALGEAAAEELRALLLQGGGQGKKRAEDQQQQQRRLGKRLLQLAAVLIFCVDNTQYIPKGHIPGYSEMVQRGVLQRGALALLYGFLARLASPSASSAALLPLALGVQWLQANPSFAAPEDPDQAEASARAEFLRAAADLLPSLRALEPFAPEPLGSAPLPEDKDMRGFRPLAPIHELLDWSNRSLLSEEMASQHRAPRLLAGLQALAKSIPEATKRCETSLAGSSRRILETKEWRGLMKSVEGFSRAAQAEAVGMELTVEVDGAAIGLSGDPAPGNLGNVDGSATAVDPMEEDPLEEDDGEELILFQPKQQRAAAVWGAASANPQQQSTAPKSLPMPTGAKAPLATWQAPPAAGGQSSGVSASQYTLPHMQSFQWGLGAALQPPRPQPLQTGFVSGSPDPIRKMGEALVANLGLEADDEPQSNTCTAPSSFSALPPASLPFTGAFFGGGSSSLFSSSPASATGTAPPKAFAAPFHSHADPLFPSNGGSTLVASALLPGCGAQGLPVDSSAPSAPRAGSGLGDGYGWLEALEAQQHQPLASNAAGPGGFANASSLTMHMSGHRAVTGDLHQPSHGAACQLSQRYGLGPRPHGKPI